MTSTDEKHRDPELGESALANTQPVEADTSRDISPEKSKDEKGKDGEDGKEKKENQGSIKDYFVSLFYSHSSTLLTDSSESSGIVIDLTGPYT